MAPKILFGRKDEWERLIEKTIDRARFGYSFGTFSSASLEDYDAIVPFYPVDYPPLRARPDLVGRKFWLPSVELTELFEDKLALNRRLGAGPHARLVPTVYDYGFVPFPYILKKSHDGYGMNSFVIRNAEEAKARAHLLADPDYFRQAYVVGDREYTTHLLMVHGRVAYQRTTLFEMGAEVYVKGIQHKAIGRFSIPPNAHAELYGRILAELGYNGLCCVNYKMEGNLPMLLEINPRFGASLCHYINEFLPAYLDSLRRAP